MDNIQIGDFFKKNHPDLEIGEGRQFAEVKVSPDNLYGLAKTLRENIELQFDFLVCITGVDYGQELGVVYHLRSTVFNHTIVIKSRTADRSDPKFDSVSDIWKTADFLEREVFDLFGIKFTNHPDLRRLFLDSSWGFPLRKDYADEINIVTR